MGKGPFVLVESDIVARLKDKFESINEIVVESKENFPMEIGTTFELLRFVADEVRLSVSKQAFPLILAGNCNTTLGAISGLMPRNLGLIWFDAHGDYNTPETTTSGFLDAMGLSMITGHCWQSLAKTIPNYDALPENRVLFVGVLLGTSIGLLVRSSVRSGEGRMSWALGSDRINTLKIKMK